MEELLIALFRLIGTIILETMDFVSWPTDFRALSPGNSIEPSICGFIIGCGLSALSLIFFKHVWISPAALRIANTFITPVISGWAAKIIAQWQACRRPRRYFWATFWFVFGVVIVRFTFADRG